MIGYRHDCPLVLAGTLSIDPILNWSPKPSAQPELEAPGHQEPQVDLVLVEGRGPAAADDPHPAPQQEPPGAWVRTAAGTSSWRPNGFQINSSKV